MSSREEFESWACKHWPYLAQEIRYRRDGLPADDPRYMNYCSYDLQAAWDAWQASRQALEIKLPKPCTARSGFSHGDELYNSAIGRCREAIEAAGVRTKP